MLFSLYESILVFCQTFCGTELESRTEEGKCSSLTSILKLHCYFDIEGNIKNSQKLFSFLLYYAELEECINFLAFPLDLTLFLISPAPEQKQKQLQLLSYITNEYKCNSSKCIVSQNWSVFSVSLQLWLHDGSKIIYTTTIVKWRCLQSSFSPFVHSWTSAELT